MVALTTPGGLHLSEPKVPGTIVIDLDGTLCWSASGMDYSQARPRPEVVDRLREYHSSGYRIAIHTARNMRSFAGNIGRITARTVPIIVSWLEEHEVPYDEVYVGKPWPGENGFSVDDRTIRPSEFLRLSAQQIADLLDEERE